MHPAKYQAERQELQYKLKKVKTKNQTLPQNKQVSTVIKGRTLLLDNIPQLKPVRPPTVAELLAVDSKEQNVMDNTQLAASDIVKEKGSYLCDICCKSQKSYRH